MKENIDLILGIPTYNSAAFLPDIFSFLNEEEVVPKKIIFVDNHSKDGTVALINNFIANTGLNVEFYQNEKNIGISGNYNRIIDESNGAEWLQIMDSDDLPLPGYYTAVKAALNSVSTETKLLVSSMRSNLGLLNFSAKFMELLSPKKVPRFVQVQGTFSTKSGLIFRMSDMKKHRYIDPVFDGSDIIFTYKFMNKNLYLPKAKVFYRIHGDSNTKKLMSSNDDYRSFLKSLKGIDRLAYQVDFMLRKFVRSVVR